LYTQEDPLPQSNCATRYMSVDILSTAAQIYEKSHLKGLQ